MLHPVIRHHLVNTLGWPGLRPLQAQAVPPVLRGDDCILIAPTAGGKTEAALLPLLTRMEDEEWRGLSVLYICPLKALLNNLAPRVAAYAAWLGRDASVRHGDTQSGERRRQMVDRPSILLTTPESLEAMLVSTLMDSQHMFGDVRAVVIDEVHAFAGDDRGWHLLATLERVSAVAGRPLQRIGLSATVGNPKRLLGWLQGTHTGRARTVVRPAVEGATEPELALDYVGSVRNAARVVSGIHAGEKRLLFADSRKTVEAVAVELRDLGVDTYVSHSSLSVGERRRAEEAFATARDCVIVSTSTLELGIDVGDLDRVVQLGAPLTVASVLQRLGRSGRRSGSRRNATFLATEDEELLRAGGLLLLLEEGFVESVTPPPEPRHIAAQQLLGLALQKGRISIRDELEWMARLGLASGGDLVRIASALTESQYLDGDQGLAFIGPHAELAYGRRHFMDLLAAFTTAPEVTVIHGRQEIGSVDPTLLTLKIEGPRIIALAGRPWEVRHIDWKRKRAYVEASDRVGRARWLGEPRAYSFALSDAIRRLMLGATPEHVELTGRALTRLETLRAQHCRRVEVDASVVAEEDGRVRWWTYAGLRANGVLTAALGEVAPDLLDQWIFGNFHISLRSDATAVDVSAALRAATDLAGDDLAGIVAPVSANALKGLKFAEMLPLDLARATLSVRNADINGAATIVSRPVLTVA